MSHKAATAKESFIMREICYFHGRHMFEPRCYAAAIAAASRISHTLPALLDRKCSSSKSALWHTRQAMVYVAALFLNICNVVCYVTHVTWYQLRYTHAWYMINHMLSGAAHRSAASVVQVRHSRKVHVITGENWREKGNNENNVVCPPPITFLHGEGRIAATTQKNRRDMPPASYRHMRATRLRAIRARRTIKQSAKTNLPASLLFFICLFGNSARARRRWWWWGIGRRLENNGRYNNECRKVIGRHWEE